MKRELFRYVSDEVSQTDFFTSLVAWSLESGPTALNAIHDDMEFGEETELVATQWNGLPNTSPENSQTRTLDWVFQDATKLVGYESKTGSDEPSVTQLREERRKLEVNGNGRDVILYAVTDHTEPPPSVDRAGVKWLSWYDVARRVLSLDTDETAIRMLQEMFRETGYEEFTGFTKFKQDSRWLTKHDSEFVKLAFNVDHLLDDVQVYRENRKHFWWYRSSNLNLLNERGDHSINQAYLMIHFFPTDWSNGFDDKYWMGLFLPALKNDLYVYVDINARKSDVNREFVQSNASTLGRLVEEQNMHLRASWNSFNSPDREFQRYDSAVEIENVLKTKAGKRNWKRLLFGWPVSVDQSPEAIVQESAERFRELNALFFHESDYFAQDDLPIV